MDYAISRSVDLPFDLAIDKVTEGLKEEGFGVLTTIDVRDTLAKKLGVEFRRYVILGACNPPFAHQALQADENIGLLLPCNVIISEHGSKTYVAAFNPQVMSALVEDAGVEPIARELKVRLERVLHHL
jgi:uncharacterized protein (DUF302 family)